MSTSDNAAEAMINEQSGPDHRWLERLLGEWTYQVKAATDEPSQTFHGRERARRLGELWIVVEGQGEMPCGEARTSTGYTLMTLGYDARRQQYVGTWIGSMMTHLWVYQDGHLDDTGKVLTLQAEGPSMIGEGVGQYKDVIEIIDDDHRVLRGYAQQPDGQWMPLMEAQMQRQA